MKTTIQEDEPKFAMAPMIDMVFLLLVFFMCASHLSHKQNIPLEVPTASKAVVPDERPNRWVVNITQEGNLFSGEQGVTLDTLALEIRKRLGDTPNLKVYIRADANAPHKEVKKVMTELADVGIDEFIFGVYVPSES